MSRPLLSTSELVAAIASDPQALDALAAALGPRLAGIAQPPEFLRPAEAAELLRCDPSRVRRLVSEGALPAMRDSTRILIRRHDLDTYLRGGQ